MNSNIFVTLFDSGYLDKGLVLFDSLCRNVIEFKLYIIAFDDVCEHILKKICDSRLVVIPLAEFEDDKLLEVKNNRSKTAYCWTCSSLSIKYVLEKYKEPICTYIDADMFFYSNPYVLLEELNEKNDDVGIMKHGFIECLENQAYIDYSGMYCVEFNTFKNTPNGLKVLDWWCEQCINYCREGSDGVNFGDQKYLEFFDKLFDGIHIYKNEGGGVAPWNVAKFKLVDNCGDTYCIENRFSHKEYNLIFYHFQMMQYISENEININLNPYPHKPDLEFINLIYTDYINLITEKRTYLNTEADLFSAVEKKQKETFWQFVLMTLRTQRNVYLFAVKILRWIFQKKNDYFLIEKQ